jgi:hypothetical protein
MTPWIFLLLTILSGYIAYDSFRWGDSLKDAPFSVISSMWKGGVSHLPLSEQNKIKDRYASSVFGVVQFQLIFSAVTIGLAIATVRAFLE